MDSSIEVGPNYGEARGALKEEYKLELSCAKLSISWS